MNISAESHEITEATLRIWRTLPQTIREDPCFALFQQEFEKLCGNRAFDDESSLTIQNSDGFKGPEECNQTTQNLSNEVGPGKELNSCKGTTQAVSVEVASCITVQQDKKPRKWLKIALLLIVWGVFTWFLMRTTERVVRSKMLLIPANEYKDFVLPNNLKNDDLEITLKGPFDKDHHDFVSNSTRNCLFVYVQRLHSYCEDTSVSCESDLELTHNLTHVWSIPIVDENLLDFIEGTMSSNVFAFHNLTPSANGYGGNLTLTRLRMSTNMAKGIPLEMSYNETPIDRDAGVIYAAIVLCGLYIMIIWEVVHRTFAAMIAATFAIGILAAMDERPEMSMIIGWIDAETLLLLFGMMILVAILSETGLFDYLAVFAYKITKGSTWPLIYCLCLFNALMSSILDNVTAALLMTPTTIRLCEVMNLNPVPILISMIIYSNIGGALTPVGDPPNVIIASNKFITNNGVNFTTFTIHMSIGVILVMAQTFVQLRLRYRNVNALRFGNESQGVKELREKISLWEKAAASLTVNSNDVDLIHQIISSQLDCFKDILSSNIASTPAALSFRETLEDLQKKYPIRSKYLLFTSGFALLFVLALFFLHSVPDLQNLSLGWSALIGAMLLLILVDRQDMETILGHVEWATLLFFGALFILMEALSELGLIGWIGSMTKKVILTVDEDSRLTVAVLLILWVSALASAFLDNIPVTTMMVKVVISLVQNDEIDLPLQPLVWALSFGACLGGNGTLIGASANLVCASIAEQHGYKFSFMEYFKVAFPVMIGGVIMSTVYLLVAHVLIEWH